MASQPMLKVSSFFFKYLCGEADILEIPFHLLWGWYGLKHTPIFLNWLVFKDEGENCKMLIYELQIMNSIAIYEIYMEG